MVLHPDFVRRFQKDAPPKFGASAAHSALSWIVLHLESIPVHVIAAQRRIGGDADPTTVMDTDEDVLGGYGSGGENDEELMDDGLVHNEPDHGAAQTPARRIIKPSRGPRTLDLEATGVHQVLHNAGCPTDIGAWRRRIFELADPVYMTLEQYKTIWPYIDNFWVYNKRNLGSLQYRCLFGQKQKPSRGSGVRPKTVRAIFGCPCYMKVVPHIVSGNTVGYTLERRGRSHAPNHDIEKTDMKRLNSGIARLVTEQVHAGVSAPEVRDVMHAMHDPVARQHFLDAGGQKLDLFTVHNLAQPFKRAVAMNASLNDTIGGHNPAATVGSALKHWENDPLGKKMQLTQSNALLTNVNSVIPPTRSEPRFPTVGNPSHQSLPPRTDHYSGGDMNFSPGPPLNLVPPCTPQITDPAYYDTLPQTPSVPFRNVYDADFGYKVCRRFWQLQQVRTDRYGRYVAAAFPPGRTPPEARSAYQSAQDELARQMAESEVLLVAG